VSSDALFAAFDRASDAIHRQAKIRDLRREIRNPPTCGTCQHWMKSRECPRQKPSMRGYSKGPSSTELPCHKFSETQTATDLRNARRAALAELEGAKP
jgi:hypothetical protein